MGKEPHPPFTNNFSNHKKRAIIHKEYEIKYVPDFLSLLRRSEGPPPKIIPAICT